MTTIHELIGARIRETRKSRGIRQEELAERLGLTRTSISNYERGVQTLTVEGLYALCGVLNIQPHALLPNAEERQAATTSPEFWERMLTFLNAR